MRKCYKSVILWFYLYSCQLGKQPSFLAFKLLARKKNWDADFQIWSLDKIFWFCACVKSRHIAENYWGMLLAFEWNSLKNLLPTNDTACQSWALEAFFLEAHLQSWALPVFFNFFTNKKWFLVFFMKLIWLGVVFLSRNGAEIGYLLYKKCKKIIFICEKMKIYRKCPALPTCKKADWKTAVAQLCWRIPTIEYRYDTIEYRLKSIRVSSHPCWSGPPPPIPSVPTPAGYSPNHGYFKSKSNRPSGGGGAAWNKTANPKWPASGQIYQKLSKWRKRNSNPTLSHRFHAELLTKG